MGKLRFASIVGVSGLGMLILGAALFQFYALGQFGEMDHVIALGAGFIGAGGLMLIASRAGT